MGGRSHVMESMHIYTQYRHGRHVGSAEELAEGTSQMKIKL